VVEPQSTSRNGLDKRLAENFRERQPLFLSIRFEAAKVTLPEARFRDRQWCTHGIVGGPVWVGRYERRHLFLYQSSGDCLPSMSRRDATWSFFALEDWARYGRQKHNQTNGIRPGDILAESGKALSPGVVSEKERLNTSSVNKRYIRFHEISTTLSPTSFLSTPTIYRLTLLFRTYVQFTSPSRHRLRRGCGTPWEYRDTKGMSIPSGYTESSTRPEE